MFCGSSLGVRNIYRDAAVKVGTTLARQGIGLVYGGSNVGLMGAMADAALAAGGEVTGVIPEGAGSEGGGPPWMDLCRPSASTRRRRWRSGSAGLRREAGLIRGHCPATQRGHTFPEKHVQGVFGHTIPGKRRLSAWLSLD